MIETGETSLKTVVVQCVQFVHIFIVYTLYTSYILSSFNQLYNQCMSPITRPVANETKAIVRSNNASNTAASASSNHYNPNSRYKPLL